MQILGISGSLRAASHNTALLRAAQLAPDGVTLDIYPDLELLPPYNEDSDTDDPPAEVARLRAEIDGADAVLFSTPEYNTTMPGQVKQVIDWASRLRQALGVAGATVLNSERAVARAQDRFTEDGELGDPETRDRLVELVSGLAEHHRRYARLVS
jgi:chromate reductase